jgi:hypothetical protein
VITLAGATVRVKAENYQSAATAAAQANVRKPTLIRVDDQRRAPTKVIYSQIVEAILRESGSRDR